MFIGVYLSINIENFTNNLIHKESRLFCQLSKLLKSRFHNETMFKSTITNALKDGGAKQDRTADLLRARQALSQLSYSPNDSKDFTLTSSGRESGGSEWT